MDGTVGQCVQKTQLPTGINGDEMSDLIEKVQAELKDFYHPDDGNLFRERCSAVIAVVLRDHKRWLNKQELAAYYLDNYARENGIKLDEPLIENVAKTLKYHRHNIHNANEWDEEDNDVKEYWRKEAKAAIAVTLLEMHKWEYDQPHMKCNAVEYARENGIKLDE
jgi:hypothetical protein